MGRETYLVDELENCFNSLNWKWAKTYEKFAPHWYCKRHTCKDVFMFDFVLQVIEYKGKYESFGKQKFKYYYCGGFKYWLTNITKPMMILINKAKI